MDGSWTPDCKRGGTGCIATNSNNVVLGIKACYRDGFSSSQYVEGMTVLFALQWLKMKTGSIASSKRIAWRYITVYTKGVELLHRIANGLMTATFYCFLM